MIDETALMEACPTVQEVSSPRELQTSLQEARARVARRRAVRSAGDVDDAEAQAVQSEGPEQPYAYPVGISPARQRAILVLLALGNFCVGASVSLQAPFFPHEAEVKGVSSVQCGFVFSVFELTIFIVGPIFAKIVPIVTPRFMLLAGLFFVGSASVLFGFLNMCPPGASFLGLAIATRIVEGVGTAGFQTAVFTIIAAEFPENLATAYSIQQTVFGAGLVAGPTVGGCLYQLGGFELPFVATGSLMLVCNFLVYWLLPPTGKPNPSRRTGNLLKFWWNLGVILDAYCVFGTFVIIGYNAAALEPHLRQFHMQPYQVGLVFVLNGAVYASTAWIWGRLADRTYYTKELAIVACTILCASLLLLGPAPFLPMPTAVWSVMVALAIFGFGSGGTIVCSFAGSFRDTLDRGFSDNLATYGLVSSVFTSSHSMGAFVGPTLGGYLLDTVGFRMGTTALLVNEILLVGALNIYERDCTISDFCFSK
ncbi:MFS-type transporter SLC18B1-like [Ixodes scapularis]|uniref:MFS-type transporter SLC18B1-like n=1 Tax=Ixodes scapularis TaxID=6945 RepID=UPI001C394236|nr:MFS-type transporter SLC18B1-like [Ixodes scapularis]